MGRIGYAIEQANLKPLPGFFSLLDNDSYLIEKKTSHKTLLPAHFHNLFLMA
jgi:hypothetical protein